MKKFALTALLFAAGCVCGGSQQAYADDMNPADDNLVVTNQCDRVVHVTIEHGSHVGGVTVEAGQVGQINTVNGNVYHAQVFEGYVPVVPYDYKTGVRHNAKLKVVNGGMFGAFCVFE